MAENEFFSLLWGTSEASAILFYTLKCRRRGQEVKRPFDHYWWAELNFGQEPEFLEESVFKLFPEKLFSNY